MTVTGQFKNQGQIEMELRVNGKLYEFEALLESLPPYNTSCGELITAIKKAIQLSHDKSREEISVEDPRINK